MLMYHVCLYNFRSDGFNDQLAKLPFELDIRLADIKSLNEVSKCSQFANIGQINKAENRSPENVCGTANEKNPPTSIKLGYSDH